MPFSPKVGDIINIAGIAYSIAEHPAARGMPYGQEGRQAIVYKVVSGTDKRALKVFKPRYRVPGLVTVSHRLESFADLPSLQVCHRTVLTPQRHATLLREHPDLVYAVVMPWIDGPTWMEVLLEKGAFTPEQSLSLARSFAEVLSAMEQRSVAHCDLSSPNVLLPSLVEQPASGPPSPIELVDVEQLHAPGMDRPATVPTGSMGYAHHSAPNSSWSPEADRFAGAVLLAEMLGCCDERVKEAAWGESYFDPKEMHHDSERYRVMERVLMERWGGDVSRLLERAWHSDTLADCATFGEWLLSLPEEVPIFTRSAATMVRVGSPQLRDSVASEENASAGAVPDKDSIATLRSEAQQLDDAGNLGEALEKYRQALALAPAGGSVQRDLLLVIQKLQVQLASISKQPGRASNTSTPVVAPNKPVSPNAELAMLFDDGLAAYRRQEWVRAKGLFSEIVHRQPSFAMAGQEARVLLADVEQRLAAKTPVRRSRTWALVPAVLLIALVFFGGIALLQAQSAATGQAQATTTAIAQSTASAVAVQASRTQAEIATVRALETSTALVVARRTSTAHSQETARAVVFSLQSATAVALSTSYTQETAQARTNELATANAFSTSQAVIATVLALSSVTPGRIAFISDRDGNYEIYVMNADGSQQTRLTNNPAIDGAPTWSPDGQRIAFPSNRDGNYEIYVMNADGSQQARLTNNYVDDQRPIWSLDGKYIAFESVRDGNYEIYVMNANGSQQTRLTNNPATDEGPAWSLDGRYISFESDRDGNDKIYVMNADGSQQARLTNNSATDWWPAWSPK